MGVEVVGMKRLAFTLLLPCLVIVWVLLTSHAVWEVHWVTPVRGPNHPSRDADGLMICLALLPLAYGLTLASWFQDLVQMGGRNITPPTTEEAGIVVALMRLGVTVLAYLFAYQAWIHR